MMITLRTSELMVRRPPGRGSRVGTSCSTILDRASFPSGHGEGRKRCASPGTSVNLGQIAALVALGEDDRDPLATVGSGPDVGGRIQVRGHLAVQAGVGGPRALLGVRLGAESRWGLAQAVQRRGVELLKDRQSSVLGGVGSERGPGLGVAGVLLMARDGVTGLPGARFGRVLIGSDLTETESDRGHGRGGQEELGKSSRSEEHTSELQSLMRISYAVFCLKK